MELSLKKENTNLTVAVKGRIDSQTAGQLEEELKQQIQDVNSVIFDCQNLEYMSSAGLRIMLATAKLTGKRNGTTTLKNINPEIRNVLEITGMITILNVE